MSVPSAETSQYELAAAVQPPLDAAERLYTYQEIRDAAPYFVVDGDPVQLHCIGLEDEKDGYNPSGIHAVIVYADDTETTDVTMVRTEAGAGAYAAQSRFCRYDPSGELTELTIERRPWEDAALCVLSDGTIVTSGVRVVWNEDDPSKVERFFTEYYSGPSLEEQVYLGQSPDGHKDSRLGVIDGRPILWIRPQERCFEGKIYYTILSGIEELRGQPNEQGERVARAVYGRAKPVGAGIFADRTWGGPNGAKDVGNGWALVECHVAQQQWEGSAVYEVDGERRADIDEVRIYDDFFLVHHPVSGHAYIFGSHDTEGNYPPGGAKWPFVRRVLFPGGPHAVTVSPDGHVEGQSTRGVRDKDMYVQRWRTIRSLAPLIESQVSSGKLARR